MRTSTRRRAIGAILVLVSLLMVTCDNFSLSDSFYSETDDPATDDPETVLPLAIFPATAATWTSGILEFVGEGGVPEYTFSVQSVEGMDVGTINPDTGVYTAPSNAGEFSVTVTDQAGESGLAVVYVVEEDPLRISPRSASVAAGADPEQFVDFTATGGEGGYVFSTDPEGVGDVVPIADDVARFTPSTAAGSVSIRVTSGTSTVAASVFVYDGNESEIQVIVDAPEIAQGESTEVRIVGGSGSYAVEELGPAGDIDYLGATLGILEEPFEPDWTGRYIAGESIGEIGITATDDTTSETSLVVITVLPATPTNLDGVAKNPNSIELTWDHTTPWPDAESAGFDIFRKSADNAMMEWIGEASSDQRSFTDDDVSPSVSYYIYEIVAFTESFESRPSGRITTTSK